MLRFVRVIIIIKRILDIDLEDWEPEFDGGMLHARLRQPGWQAELRSAHDDSVAYDLETFLRACRSTSFSYKIDLWVDDEGLVLSATQAGKDTQVILLKRGQWESRLFGLPSPKSKLSPHYCDVLR